MSFQQFLEKWNGQYCEVAGSSNAVNQCVDLANAYIRDVLGFPIIEWTNAIDFPSKAGDKYDYIKNTPTGIPNEGDLVIWDKSPGHIAIFIQGTTNSFTSFDQNYPLGSPCHVQGHTYTNVLGWLHPKTTPITDQECMPKNQADDFRRVKEGWNQIRTLLDVEDSVTVVLAEIKKLIGYEDAVVKKDKELTDTMTELNTIKGQMLEEQETNKKLALEVTVLTQKASDLEGKYQSANKTIEEALVKISELEKQQTNPDSGWKKIVDGFLEIFHFR